MFHELNFFSDRRSYYVDTNARDRLFLNNLYKEVSDTARPWPRATGRSTAETKEYRFDCVGLDRQGRQHTVAQISYLDFAGVLLEDDVDVNGDSFAMLSDAIKHASALLVLIDGRRVRQLLDNDPEGNNHFKFTLPPTLGFAQSVGCPVHMVLTKWDLIQSFPPLQAIDDPTRLERVVDALMEFPQVKGLVDMRGPGQTVRIIPVSSVGRGFVEIDDQGRVVKKPDATLRPTNIAAPVAAVVPDFFKRVEVTLGPQTREKLDEEVSGSQWSNTGEFVSQLTSVIARPAWVVLRTVLTGFVGAELAESVYTWFIDYLSSENTEPGPDAADEPEPEIAEIRELRARVLRDFTKTVDHLEALYPSSLLKVATSQG
jgi:hypothetical protein